MGVFGFLAARFNYPAVLDGSAQEVFPQLLATGRLGRAAWAIYALLPLIWLPAGVGAYSALRRFAPGAMLLALLFAGMASISMMLGLMRWPSIHWRLAAVVASINNYLLPVWMIAFGIVLLRYARLPESIAVRGNA